MRRVLLLTVLALVLPVHAQAPRLQAQMVTATITALAISADKNLIATGEIDGRVLIWERHTGRILRSVYGLPGPVDSLSFSPVGKLLAAANGAGVLLIDVSTGKIKWGIPAGDDEVMEATFSGDGNFILVAQNSFASIWDVGRKKRVRRLVPPQGGRLFYHALFSPNRKQVLAGGADGLVLWDLDSGKIRQVEDSGSVTSLAFAESGVNLALVGGHSEIGVLDTRSAQIIQTMSYERESLNAVAFVAGGQEALAGLNFGGAVLFDVSTGQVLRKFEGHGQSGIGSANAFSADGSLALTLGDETGFRLWDTETERELSANWPSMLALDSISSIEFFAGGKRMLVTTGNRACVWDLVNKGRQVACLKSESDEISFSRVAEAANAVITVGYGGRVELWDLRSNSLLQHFDGYDSALFETPAQKPKLVDAAVSPDRQHVVAAYAGDSGYAVSWSVANAARESAFRTDKDEIHTVSFVESGPTVAIECEKNLWTWNVVSGTQESEVNPSAAALPTLLETEIMDRSRDGVRAIVHGYHVIGAEWNRPLRILNLRSQESVWLTGIPSGWVLEASFSADGDFVVTLSQDMVARVWDAHTGRILASHPVKDFEKYAISPNHEFLFAASEGLIRVFRLGDEDEFITLFSGKEEKWGVLSASGEFDTGDLDSIAGFQWVFPKEPLKALPPEVFMRDFYEPGLLRRLLATSNSRGSRPQRPLAKLNRTQPQVGEPQLTLESTEEFVTVRVAVKDPGGDPIESGVYDLRLFRDGQLIARAPLGGLMSQLESEARESKSFEKGLMDWRRALHVRPGLPEVERVELDGTMIVRFERVRLPRRAGQQFVDFSAYAFNADRVKSTTVNTEVPLPSRLEPRKGKAYVITMGVNRTRSSPAWDLSFAVNDARELSQVVSQGLRDSKNFAEVIPICLLSDHAESEVGNEHRCETELPATSANLRAVLDVLAGRSAEESIRASLGRIRERAQPEDLVLISISSHGYTDRRGIFHFVTADVNEPQQVTAVLDRSTLNTNDLSIWLSNVDAGELVLIADACQSEATIQSEGFRAGPMGSPGLGQLAYDKGMRVLAASKARESAFERDRIKHGLLTYALAIKGLRGGEADSPPYDRRITMSEWLRFAEVEVPELFAEGEARGGTQRRGAPEGVRDGYLGRNKTPVRYQQPVLFDFARTRVDLTVGVID